MLQKEDVGVFLKRHILLTIMVVLLSFFLFPDEEDILKIEASISPKRLSRGQEGKVIINLTLKDNITIIPQPSFIIEFSPSEELIFPKNFFTASDLEIEILEENGKEYLNLKDPIEIPFTVNLEAKRGDHTLEGKIKYFACSSKEGWCLKNTSKFLASFYTRSTIFKKKK